MSKIIFQDRKIDIILNVLFILEAFSGAALLIQGDVAAEGKLIILATHIVVCAPQRLMH